MVQTYLSTQYVYTHCVHKGNEILIENFQNTSMFILNLTVMRPLRSCRSNVKRAGSSLKFFSNDNVYFVTSYTDIIHLDLPKNTNYHGFIMNSFRKNIISYSHVIFLHKVFHKTKKIVFRN